MQGREGSVGRVRIERQILASARIVASVGHAGEFLVGVVIGVRSEGSRCARGSDCYCSEPLEFEISLEPTVGLEPTTCCLQNPCLVSRRVHSYGKEPEKSGGTDVQIQAHPGATARVGVMVGVVQMPSLDLRRAVSKPVSMGSLVRATTRPPTIPRAALWVRCSTAPRSRFRPAPRRSPPPA